MLGPKTKKCYENGKEKQIDANYDKTLDMSDKCFPMGNNAEYIGETTRFSHVKTLNSQSVLNSSK